MNNKLWFVFAGIILGFMAGWFLKPSVGIPVLPESAQVYFVKNVQAGEEFVGVGRQVDPLAALASVLVQAILAGPSGIEMQQGLTSAISSAAKLNYVRIDGVVAYVDFNSDFDRNVAGSARVIAIQNQINKTLTALPGIEEVRLTIDFETRPAVLEP